MQHQRNEPQLVSAQLAGVLSLRTVPGDRVRAGQVLGTIEAMKLEAPILAPSDGVVTRVFASDHQHLTVGDQICEIGERA